MAMILKHGSRFWTGRSWAPEYPEARIYAKSIPDAEVDRAVRVAEGNGHEGVELTGYVNYGMRNEWSFPVLPSWQMEEETR